MPEPTTTAPCPICPKPVDEHTVAELREHLSTVHDHNLPYEDLERERDEAFGLHQFAGSITVEAAAVDTGAGVYPVLVFEFGGNAMRSFPPIPLVLDDNAMRNVRRLVGEAIDAAVKGARRAR